MHASLYQVNVSVFETTIRVLGGLLSAHLLATDPFLGIYNTSLSSLDEGPGYQGELLGLAIDLGGRLLPAFNTKTGIPYGTVNLRYGCGVWCMVYGVWCMVYSAEIMECGVWFRLYAK
ncbi:hypothetical protein EON63_21490 [archaeon]|nr:MAG: hypothetical protein EON63_21490 [archaeon]